MGVRIATLILLGLVLAGCESSRTEPPAVYPQAPRVGFSTREASTIDQIIAAAATKPLRPPDGAGWKTLFDGSRLDDWRITPFAGRGDVELFRGMVICWMGEPFTGINYTNDLPVTNYEISLEAMRVSGSDFFCGLTFPVRDSHCSLIIGGWGGTLVGLSSLDGYDASENETMQIISFETGRWYRIRLRVTAYRIEAWIEQKKVVDVVTAGRTISLRAGEIERSRPLGLASWTTSAAYRDIHIRSIPGSEAP